MPAKKLGEMNPMDRAAAGQIGRRLQSFLAHSNAGSQNALSKKLGLSQPAISRVLAGEQLPSGRLLLALLERSELNIEWLLSGRGRMFRNSKATSGTTKESTPTASPILVAKHPLPGSPSQCRDQLCEESSISSKLFPTESSYFLQAQMKDPVVKSTWHKIKAGDLLLMETDRGRFPDVDSILEELWVVRLRVGGRDVCRLAEVSHVEADWLQADTFDLHTEPSGPLGRRGYTRLEPFPLSFQNAITCKGSRRVPRAVDVPREPYSISSDKLVARHILTLRP